MNAAVTDSGGEPARGQPIKGRRILENLPTRARTTGAAAAARSRMVKRLRMVLPILALFLIVAFILTTQPQNEDTTFLKDFEQVRAATDDLHMASPRFAGLDDNGRPFEITAASAKQTPGNRDIVELEMPRAIQGNAGEESVVTANSGVYRSEFNMLDLSDNVTLEHKIGGSVYVLSAPAATVSINDEIVTSNVGVYGQGPDGETLKADQMKAYNREGRVVFEGNVSMRIYPKSKNTPDDHDASKAPDLKEMEINKPL